MIRLSCSTGLTARRRERQASNGEPATVADYASCILVAVVVFSPSLTYLDADVCVAAWSGGIAVVVELTLIFAQYRTDGTLATILANVAVNAWCLAVGVGIRLASGTLHARGSVRSAA